MQVARSSAIKLGAFAGTAAVAMACQHFEIEGQAAAGLVPIAIALAGAGAHALFGHLGVQLIETASERADRQKGSKASDNSDLHRLIGNAIGGVLEKEIGSAPGGSVGAKYLRSAAEAFRGSAWLTVELVGVETSVGAPELASHFISDGGEFMRNPVLSDIEWFNLVEKVAGPTPYQETDLALRWAAKRLHDGFAAELCEAMKNAWKERDLAWPALILRLLSLILTSSHEAASNSLETAGQLNALREQITALSNAIGKAAIAASDAIPPADREAYAEVLIAFEHSQATLGRQLGSVLTGQNEIKEQLAALREKVGGASTTINRKKSGAGNKTGKAAAGPTQSKLRISYGELLDPHQITREGKKVAVAAREGSSRASLQPFLDKYSDLLPLAIEMVRGDPTSPAYSSIMDFFPVGHSEPAWVAIVRGGGTHLCTDGGAHVQIFLPGDDPQKVYLENYSVIRHALQMLLLLAEEALHVEVFAYQNNYTDLTLALSPDPFSLTRSEFGPPPHKTSSGLTGLETFFQQGPEIRGGTLTQQGLVLSGVAGPAQTVSGERVSLSDLAVVYRAVFHARDNTAFVSIDPALDATKSTVNFGGFLENTRAGAVLLAADKRFKTISVGLDPNLHTDVRTNARSHVEGFLTSAERSLSSEATAKTTEEPNKSKGWISTRFWFYPDGITLHVDDQFETAAIVKPRFTADAERSRSDFESQDEYEKKKREFLEPSHRDNIDDLNRRYGSFSNAFPELSELDTVARLWAICVWLARRSVRRLDLDELLGVDVPFCSTATEMDRLIVSAYLSYPLEEGPRRNIESSQIALLTPLLNKTVAEVFGSSNGMAKYIAGLPQHAGKQEVELESTANSLFAVYKDRRVREMIQTDMELRCFSTFATGTLRPEYPPLAKEVRDAAAQDDNELTHITERRAELQSRMEPLWKRMEEIKQEATVNHEVWERHNVLVQEYSALVAEYNGAGEKYEAIALRRNERVDRLNGLKLQNKSTVTIHGGVSVDPFDFSIQIDSTTEEFEHFKTLHEQAGPSYRVMPNLEQWIRSERVEPPVISPTETTSAKRFLERAKHIKRRSAVRRKAQGCNVTLEIHGALCSERVFDIQRREIVVTKFDSGVPVYGLVGRFESDGHIVFRKVEKLSLRDTGRPRSLLERWRILWRRALNKF